MALLFLEGFEQYSTIGDLVGGRYLAPSAMPARWGWNTTNSMFVDGTGYKTAQPGGITSKAFRVSVATSSTAYTVLGAPLCTTMIFGLAYNASSLQNQSVRIISPSTASYTTGNNWVTLNLNSSGQVTLYNNRTSTYLVATAGGTVFPNVWYYVEVKLVWGATGSAEVRLDGLSVGTASSVDTRTHTSDSGFSQLGFGVFAASPNVNSSYYDDIYVCNDSGATHNDFLGPVAVYTLFPTANGTTNQFTPTGVASNWDAVNEQAADTVTYVGSSTPSNVDKYNVPDLPVTPATVHAVAVGSMATKSESSARQYRNTVTVGGTTANGATVTPAMSQYNTSHDLFVTAPGGSAWTASDVNSMEIGVECL